MKNRYLKSLTARVTILMLSFLCLAGSQGAGAQIPMERRNSSSTSVVSSQKPVMPRMTKSGGNAVSVNGTEYDTWLMLLRRSIQMRQRLRSISYC